MSVINQVLNQLERRGAYSTVDQPMVRAVIHPGRNYFLPLMIGLLLIVGIVVWQWLSPSNQAKMADAVEVVQKNEVAPPVELVLSQTVENESTDLVITETGSSSESNSQPPYSPHEEDVEQESSRGNIKPAPAELAVSSVVTSKSPKLEKTVAVQAANSVATESVVVVPVVAALATKAETIAVVQAASSVMPIKKVSSTQLADAEFRRAAGLMQLGRMEEAIAGYKAALLLDEDHAAARQALVVLLLESKRNADAENVLIEGLSNKPEKIEFIMLLARLQVERGALGQATETLLKSLPFAEMNADYRAFLAALLQRQNRNQEAILHYQVALQYEPGSGIWLMGYGISLQAIQRNAEAKEAFQRALDTRTLAPGLQQFVQQKLKGL